MKKRPASRIAERDPDEILPEYDLSNARRNPYAARYHDGSLVVALDADVAKRFPSARAVNDALRSLSPAPIRKSNSGTKPVPVTTLRRASAKRGSSMKKKRSKVREKDDMRPEYDFSGGVRGKYAKRTEDTKP